MQLVKLWCRCQAKASLKLIAVRLADGLQTETAASRLNVGALKIERQTDLFLSARNPLVSDRHLNFVTLLINIQNAQ